MDHSAPPELSEYRWRQRLLLLFAPERSDAGYREQARLLGQRVAGLEERDLILFELFAGAGRAGPRQLSPSEVARLRDHYQVAADDFALLLIGKDGTVKRRQDTVVQPDDLFLQIDGMPMRRRELEGGT